MKWRAESNRSLEQRSSKSPKTVVAKGPGNTCCLVPVVQRTQCAAPVRVILRVTVIPRRHRRSRSGLKHQQATQTRASVLDCILCATNVANRCNMINRAKVRDTGSKRINHVYQGSDHRIVLQSARHIDSSQPQSTYLTIRPPVTPATAASFSPPQPSICSAAHVLHIPQSELQGFITLRTFQNLPSTSTTRISNNRTKIDTRTQAPAPCPIRHMHTANTCCSHTECCYAIQQRTAL